MVFEGLLILFVDWLVLIRCNWQRALWIENFKILAGLSTYLNFRLSRVIKILIGTVDHAFNPSSNIPKPSDKFKINENLTLPDEDLEFCHWI